MSIPVRCSCGVRLKAPDAAANKTLVCPRCKTRLTVPSGAPMPLAADDLDIGSVRRPGMPVGLLAVLISLGAVAAVVVLVAVLNSGSREPQQATAPPARLQGIADANATGERRPTGQETESEGDEMTPRRLLGSAPREADKDCGRVQARYLLQLCLRWRGEHAPQHFSNELLAIEAWPCLGP